MFLQNQNFLDGEITEQSLETPTKEWTAGLLDQASCIHINRTNGTAAMQPDHLTGD